MPPHLQRDADTPADELCADCRQPAQHGDLLPLLRRAGSPEFDLYCEACFWKHAHEPCFR